MLLLIKGKGEEEKGKIMGGMYWVFALFMLLTISDSQMSPDLLINFQTFTFFLSLGTKANSTNSNNVGISPCSSKQRMPYPLCTEAWSLLLCSGWTPFGSVLFDSCRCGIAEGVLWVCLWALSFWNMLQSICLACVLCHCCLFGQSQSYLTLYSSS